MIDVDIIIPTYVSDALTAMAILSYEKFSKGYRFHYYVIENSDHEYGKVFLESLNKRVTWIPNNSLPELIQVSNRFNLPHVGSLSVASAFHLGVNSSNSKYIFFSHNDVTPTCDGWLDFLIKKLDEGNSVAGMCRDKSATRINAVHSSGLLTTREFVSGLSFYPVMYPSVEYSPTDPDTGNKIIQLLDVGDIMTLKCMLSNKGHFACNNTHNDPDVFSKLKSPYDKLQLTSSIDDNNNVIFMHLGRGTPKLHGSYNKLGRVSANEWCILLQRLLGIDMSPLSALGPNKK